MGDLSAEKPPTVRLDVFVDEMAELDPQTIVDAELCTTNRTIRDTIDVEIAIHDITKEENDDQTGGRKSLAVADVMETALEDGTTEARQKLAEWKSDDSVDENALSDAEEVITEIEESNDEKQARDNASRVLGNWDED